MDLKKQVSGVVGGFVGVARRAAKRLGWGKKLDARVSRHAVVEALEGRQLMASPELTFADIFKGDGASAEDGAHVRLVVSDGDGNTYVLTEFGGKGTIQTSAGTTTVPAPTGTSSFVVSKLGTNGAVAWTQTFGADPGTDLSHMVFNQKTNEVVLAGDFTGRSIDFDPGVPALKLDAQGGRDGFILSLSAGGGTFDGLQTFDGPGSVDVLAVAANPSTGELFFTGTFEGEVDLDPTAGTSTKTAEIPGNFFVGLNGSTHVPFAVTGLGGNDTFFPSAVVPGIEGEAFVFGVQVAAADFNGDGTPDVAMVGKTGLLGVRISGDGTVLDTNPLGVPDQFLNNFLVTADGAGGVYALIDAPAGTLDLDPTVGSFPVVVSKGDVDLNTHVAVRFGRTLAPIWAKTIKEVDPVGVPGSVFQVGAVTAAGTGTGLVDFVIGGAVSGKLNIAGTVRTFTDPSKGVSPAGVVFELSGVNGALFGDPFQTTTVGDKSFSIVTNLTRSGFGPGVIADAFANGSGDYAPTQAGFEWTLLGGAFEHAVLKIGGSTGPSLTAADLTATVTNAWTALSKPTTVTIRNTGQTAAGSFFFTGFLSKDGILGEGDVSIFSGSVTGLAGGATTKQTLTASMPGGISAGTYQVIVKLDGGNSVPESNELNNTAVGTPAVTITGPAQPDLKVATLTGFTGVVGPGQVVSGSIGLTNAGKASAGANIAQIVISQDKIFGNGDDILFDEVDVPAILPGKTQAMTFSGEISNAAKDGKYYVLARVDNTDTVVESNDANNAFVGSLFSVGRPVISVAGPAAKLGETGGKGTFVFTRTGGSTGVALGVPFEITGSGVRGVDYELKVGTTVLTADFVTIPSKAGSLTVNVFAIGDSAIEGEESAKLTLLPSAGATPLYTLNALKSSANLVIVDDEPTVKLTSTSTKMAEADGTATFTIARSGGSNKQALVVDFDVFGKATQGSDFKLVGPDGKSVLSNFVTIPANAASVTIKAIGIDDQKIEGNEGFTIHLAPVEGAPTYSIDALKHEASVIVLDNEPTLKITANPTKTSESNGSVSFTVTRSGGSNKGSLTVGFTPDGKAVAGSDYKLMSPDGKSVLTNFVTIPANAASVTFKALILDDQQIEGDETFGLILTTSIEDPMYTLDPLKFSAGAVISDNEPVVTLTSTTTKTSETKGSASFTVARTGGSTKSALTVFFTTLGVGGLGTDFNLVSNDGKTFLSNSVTIPAGAASVNFKALIIDDTKIEGTEKFTLHLTGAPGEPTYTISPTKHEAQVEIADNEPTVSLVASKANASETTPLVNKGQFKFTRTGGSTTGALTVNFTIGNAASKGTATFGADYSLSAPAAAKLTTSNGNPVTGSITFAAGVSSVQVDLTVLGDSKTDEGVEQVALSLVSSEAFALEPGKAAATVTIADGKAPPPTPGAMIAGALGTNIKITSEANRETSSNIFGSGTTSNLGILTQTGRVASTSIFSFSENKAAPMADVALSINPFVPILPGESTGPNCSVNLIFNSAAARVEFLNGKTIQFFTAGTAGTMGRVIISVGADAFDGTFKIV
jgi:hypothetical protein